jgi:adenylosuccinate lyase
MPFGAILFREMVSTAEMRTVWSEDNTVSKWIEVEKAITLAQAKLQIIPVQAAEEICQNLTVLKLSPSLIKEQKRTVGHLMVSFLKAAREICGEAAEHLHVGPTTQDILDTGLCLQLKESNILLSSQLLELKRTLCAIAAEHKNTVIMGRTHGQHAVPTTLGFIVAGWATEIRDHMQRMEDSKGRWMTGGISGAVGSQNAFVELAGLDKSRALEEEVLRSLELRSPLNTLHGRTDRFAELVNGLGNLCASIARIGANFRTWQSAEVGEVRLEDDPARHSSSTMPNKDNPEPVEQLEGIAVMVRSFAAAVQSIHMRDIRDSSRLPILYTSIPQAFMMTSRALKTLTQNVERMKVDSAKMRSNLYHPDVLGQAAAERLMIALYKKCGRRHEVHERLHHCARRSSREGVPFQEVVMSDEKLGAYLTPEEMDQLFSLETYLGNSVTRTEETLQTICDEEDTSLH